MNARISGWTAATVCSCALALAAQASTELLRDGFEGDADGAGAVTDLSQWTATRGNVNVLSAGTLGVTGRGHFLDLDGDASLAARLVSKQDFTLTPGTYSLSFDVAGSQRNSAAGIIPNTMTVSLGDVFSTTVTKHFNDPFVSLDFPITVSTATTGRLVFDHAGGDNIGLLLDNVVLTNTTPTPPSGGPPPSPGPVPIPLPAAAWSGMATLAAIAGVGRLRRRRGDAAAA